MEKEQTKAPEDSTRESLDTGKKAIQQDAALEKKQKDPAKVDDQQKKDAEQWRNEG